MTQAIRIATVALIVAYAASVSAQTSSPVRPIITPRVDTFAVQLLERANQTLLNAQTLRGKITTTLTVTITTDQNVTGTMGFS